MRIIGIDPGINGAVGVITTTCGFIDVFDMPTVLANKTGNRQMVSPIDLANLLRPFTQLGDGSSAGVVAITEGVHAMPEQGVASVFAFGKSYGILLGVLAALGISVHIVSPAKWKNFYSLGREKDRSRELAQRMWPNAPLGLKKHHGRAEALMLARYYTEAIMVRHPKIKGIKRP